MKTAKENGRCIQLDGKIEGGAKYKVNGCTTSNKVYVYVWNVEESKWDIKMALVGEFSLILE
jgi:hypothetical protein